MNDLKSYSIQEVVPLRGYAVYLLRKMVPGTAVNLPLSQRKNFSVSIYRLHLKKEGLWKTVAIKNGMFAVMRLE